ncbi:MAG TPA: thioredoxin family protein [Phycisphaerae bacterium]|nr:thioredoxin family protein [Phycisphaerae bacterium]
MKVEILGTGCAKCQALDANAKAAAAKLGIDCEFSKVTSLAEIAGRGVMMTPALSIDGQVMVAGKVPSEDEIAALLSGR